MQFIFEALPEQHDLHEGKERPLRPPFYLHRETPAAKPLAKVTAQLMRVTMALRKIICSSRHSSSDIKGVMTATAST